MQPACHVHSVIAVTTNQDTHSYESPDLSDAQFKEPTPIGSIITSCSGGNYHYQNVGLVAV
jgi:hypothetical protein